MAFVRALSEDAGRNPRRSMQHQQLNDASTSGFSRKVYVNKFISLEKAKIGLARRPLLHGAWKIARTKARSVHCQIARRPPGAAACGSCALRPGQKWVE